MLKKILIGLGAIIALILIVAAMQPSEFRVERSTIINAPAATVFAQVDDFHKWEAWNPFSKMDPNNKNTYSGPNAGTGASTAWVGKKTGEGSMTILESRPNELIKIDLEFIKPMKASHIAEFTFKEEGGSTTLTWAMYGKNNFIAKIMHLFMNMDKMVGPSFAQGLTDIKTLVEASNK